MRRAAVAVVAVAATTLASGCASADHSWRGDFVARLEGASAAMAEAVGEFSPDAKYPEISRAGYRLGHTLQFKHELIRKLDPPAGCLTVQKEGQEEVISVGEDFYFLYKNLTPELQRKLPEILEEGTTNLERIEQEAETCE